MPVVHCKEEPYDVYIGRGRGSKWGNPFVIGIDGTRDEVIEKYRIWVRTQPHLMAEIHKLHGKRLGCWCGKQHCHGEVILEIAAERVREIEAQFKEIFGDGA